MKQDNISKSRTLKSKHCLTTMGNPPCNCAGWELHSSHTTMAKAMCWCVLICIDVLMCTDVCWCVIICVDVLKQQKATNKQPWTVGSIAPTICMNIAPTICMNAAHAMNKWNTFGGQSLTHKPDTTPPHTRQHTLPSPPKAHPQPHHTWYQHKCVCWTWSNPWCKHWLGWCSHPIKQNLGARTFFVHTVWWLRWWYMMLMTDDEGWAIYSGDGDDADDRWWRLSSIQWWWWWCWWLMMKTKQSTMLVRHPYGPYGWWWWWWWWWRLSNLQRWWWWWWWLNLHQTKFTCSTLLCLLLCFCTAN